jgi:diacylglycerol kinase
MNIRAFCHRFINPLAFRTAMALALLCLVFPFVKGVTWREVPEGFTYYPLVHGHLGTWARSHTGFQIMGSNDSWFQMSAAAVFIVLGFMLSFIRSKALRLSSSLAAVIALIFIYLSIGPWREAEGLVRTQVGAPVMTFEYGSGFFLCSLFLIAGAAISIGEFFNISSRE